MDITIGQFHALSAFRKDKVVRQTFIVVQKVLLDEITAITEAEYELLVPEMSEISHYVQEDWTVTNRHHGLRNVIGIVAQPQTQTATEQHYFHSDHSLTMR